MKVNRSNPGAISAALEALLREALPPGATLDISPRGNLPFPLTNFVPWAAYARLRDGRNFHLEQDELTDTLRRQSSDNPDRMSFDTSIHDMTEAEKVAIET